MNLQRCPRTPARLLSPITWVACWAAAASVALAAPAAASAATDTTRDVTTDAATDAASLAAWTTRFASEVDHRLDVPPAELQHYTTLLDEALARAQVTVPPAQAVLLVDRNPQVQAALLLVRTAAGGWHGLGAVAVSTGKVGRYEHFLTPKGVYPHTLDNPDFRAEGTYNENHIRGYGLRGRRVFDFGWQMAERGWGPGGSSPMRLQMHATDPTLLEQRLGRVDSEGCVRIPATLNVFLDRHGVLDADYEAALAAGRKLWVIPAKRELMPWPGRYLVVVDSQQAARPAWSPDPLARPPAAPKAKLANPALVRAQV